MRILMVSLLSFFVLTGCMVSKSWADDLSKGFGGIEWGAQIGSQTGLEKVGNKGNVNYYLDPHRLYDMDGETFKNVIYGFFDQSFFAAYIDIDSQELFPRIKRKLQDRYGDYKTTMSIKNELTPYRWIQKDLKIKLKHWGKSGRMKLAFYYIPILQKIDEIEQETYQESDIHFVPIEKDKKPEKWIILEW